MRKVAGNAHPRSLKVIVVPLDAAYLQPFLT